MAQNHSNAAGMKRSSWFSAIFFLAMFASLNAFAQAPSSLQYPTPNAFIANGNSVYLAPTVSGSVVSYAITPTLPAGLSLNTATGVISGVPTTSSAATTYTVTATNASGSTSTTISIATTTNVFNNNYGSLSFQNANRTFKVGTTGQSVGDIALYSGVTTINGQSIDCIVKTVAVSNVSSWNAYDQQSASGYGFSNNDDDYFSPQLDFSSAGYVTFNFTFIMGGTYNSTTHCGTSVILQNVKLNTYDIDGNGNQGSNQYNEFDGFSTSELGPNTTISTPTYNTSTGLTKYRSGTRNNSSNLTDPDTRVRLTFNNMGTFTIKVGADAGGLAYFVLDFSSGPTFSSAVVSTPPAIDLNTGTPGLDNGAVGCSSALSFTGASQTNASSGSNLTEFSISYDNTSANLPDGANEELLINGYTAGTGTHALNFSTGSTSSVTVGGVAYTITKSVSGSTSTIAFTRSSGGTTFTVSQLESLLDALQYNNSKASPTNGSRVFSVTTRTSSFASPAAVFTASLNCMSISGNIYHDVNGLSDNTINSSATGSTGSLTGPFDAGATSGVYAVLANASTHAVLSTIAITAGGAYTFGRQDPGEYEIFVSNTATPGSTMTTASQPSLSSQTLQMVGENLSAAAGTDGSADGKLHVTVGSVPVTNANFGLQLAPQTSDYSFSNQANPGGFNYFSIPSSGFTGTDADGSVSSFTITSFPGNANYLKVGSTIYTNGGTCPPQSTCTSWPGTLSLPYSSIGTLAVDPAADGNTTVTLSYTVKDNGNFVSNGGTPSTMSIPFIAPASPITVSGNVWDDADGDGVKDATESYSNAAAAGQTLYALLVQTTNTYSGAKTVYASTAVTAGASGYSFSSVPAGNDYEVHIVSLSAAPTDGVAWSSITPALATNYTGVSTNNNGSISAGQHTQDLVNSLGTVNADKPNVGFGIDQIPMADAKSFTAPNSAFSQDAGITLGGQPTYSILSNSAAMSGSNPQSLSGSDAEDCASSSSCSTGKSYKINSINSNTLLYYYDGSSWNQVTDGQTITNFNPAYLRIHGQQNSGSTQALGFNYSLVDNAGIASTGVTYSLNSIAPLPVTLTAFEGISEGCTAQLNWTSASEMNASYYEVEESADGRTFEKAYTVPAHKMASSYEVKLPMSRATSFFRLKMVDEDGSYSYSRVLRLTGHCNGQQSVEVYPNPASRSIRLSGAGDGASLRMYDLAGRVVKLESGLSEGAEINISMLPAGNYVVEVLSATGTVSHQQVVKE